MGVSMENILRKYDAKIDNKKRLTIRSSLFDYYHIKEYDDGCILLEPRELVEPFCISDNTLHMFDSSVSNLKEGRVSKALDLSEFKK